MSFFISFIDKYIINILIYVYITICDVLSAASYHITHSLVDQSWPLSHVWWRVCRDVSNREIVAAISFLTLHFSCHWTVRWHDDIVCITRHAHQTPRRPHGTYESRAAHEHEIEWRGYFASRTIAYEPMIEYISLCHVSHTSFICMRCLAEHCRPYRHTPTCYRSSQSIVHYSSSVTLWMLGITRISISLLSARQNKYLCHRRIVWNAMSFMIESMDSWHGRLLMMTAIRRWVEIAYRLCYARMMYPQGVWWNDNMYSIHSFIIYKSRLTCDMIEKSLMEYDTYDAAYRACEFLCASYGHFNFPVMRIYRIVTVWWATIKCLNMRLHDRHCRYIRLCILYIPTMMRRMPLWSSAIADPIADSMSIG